MPFGPPRGPIFSQGSDYDAPTYEGGNTAADYSTYLQACQRYRDAAKEEALATARLSIEADCVQKYIDCLSGTGWYERDRPRYKSGYYDNRMNNSRLSDLALLTDTKPTIFVSTSIDAYKNQAKMVSDGIQSEWQRQGMDMDLLDVVDITKLNGTGFWKNCAASPGILNVISCGPESVLPIQPGKNIQTSTAVLYRTYQGVQALKNKFPYTTTGLEKENTFIEMSSGGQTRFNRPDDMPDFTWNGLTPGMKRAVGVQTSSSEMSTVAGSMFKNLETQEIWIDDPSVNESKREVLMRHPYLTLKQHNYWYWVKPGERLYPRKRLMVFGGRRLLYDGPSPFWHGMYPFSCLRLNRVPWSFWGLSKYRDLMPLNKGLNDVGAGVLDMIKLALNPVSITKLNAMLQGTWDRFYPGLPGGKLMLGPNASITDVRYMDPPNIPSWVLQFHQYLSAEFDRLSGAIDVTNLTKKKQVPGGDTIEQMKEMMNSITRLEGRMIEDFLEQSGVQSVSNFFQYFEMDRRIMLLGEEGISWEDLNSTGPNLIPENKPKENHWRNFALKIATGSLLSSAKDREKSMAIQLASRGMLSIRSLHKKLELGPEEYKMLMEEHQQGVGPSGKSPRSSRGQRNGQAA